MRRDVWNNPIRHAGSTGDPFALGTDPDALAALLAKEAADKPLGPNEGILIVRVQKLADDIVTRETDRSRSDLEKAGYEHFTVGRMFKEWAIGGDRVEDMAPRAVLDGRIHDDYLFQIRPRGKYLWARRKDG
jgi:hypothetical protein